MEPGQEGFNEKFVEAVKLALPSNLKIYYISLIGSQGKNLVSPESDYDVRVIVGNPYDLYLLQRPKVNIKINTTFQGKSLEGMAVDVIKIFEYAMDTNPFIIDVLRGISIYNDAPKMLEDLRRVFLEAYLPLVSMNAFQGIMYHYIKRELKNPKGEYLEKVPAKALVECVFVVLELRCLFTNKSIIDYFNIDKLVAEFAGKDEQLFKDLIAIRRKNKKEEIPIPDEVKQILQEILNQVSEFIKSYPAEEKQKVHEKRTILQKEVDQICLDFINSNKI